MYIFDIKRYAINDGPGIRTTLFIKGCPLRCVWCHNPEGWTAQPQILYKKSKCIGCKTCVDACPQQALELTPDGIRIRRDAQCLSGHVSCKICTEECPTTALETCGREYTMEELMAEVEKERVIMEDSGGGVTLCGGEPLMHPGDTLALLRELGRRRFHRTVDTTLYAQPETVKAVTGECELFLVDLKLMDSDKHRQYTGVPNELILENIRLLAGTGKEMWIRIPVIEGINADEENMEETARFLSTLPARSEPLRVHLLPYHDVGKDKHLRMWSTYNPHGIPMGTPSVECLRRCAARLEAYGLHALTGG